VPKFLDNHGLQGADPKDLKKAQNQPKDEFGVSVLNVIYSEEADRMYCLLDAPNKEAIVKHHEKLGYKCDYILEVDTTDE